MAIKKFVKYRFFQKGNAYFMEDAEWGMAGTGLIPQNDPRAVAIGESQLNPNTNLMQDSWVPLSVGNSGCNLSAMKSTNTYKTELIMQPDGTYAAVQVIDKAVSPHPPIALYDIPLMPGITEITMEEYNAAISP